MAPFSQASVAQLAEQLICNQQVVGSSPSASSSALRERRGVLGAEVLGSWCSLNLFPSSRRARASVKGGFPSGQRGQTVNLMALPSQVRILYPPVQITND